MPTLVELLSTAETAGVWNLVPSRSTVAFKNKSLWGLLNVKGEFSDVSGDGQITGTGAVFGRLDIRAVSLGTGIRKRDEHLRSPDFFDVEKYPHISVVVTAAQPTGDTAAELRASLTVRGTTVPISLPATVRVLDDGAIAVSAKATVDRSQFGVSGNQLGMVGMVTKLSADAVFARAAGS